MKRTQRLVKLKMNNNYDTLIEKLYKISFHHKVKLGLEQCKKLHAFFGTPADTFKSIHVAGTNGKGSVCTKIAAALQNEGYKVGLFTSPHISTFRERIRINDLLISKKDVEDLLNTLFTSNIQATFFEITTLLAFLYFANEQVDYAVIETGLGGRLDATNIITPEMSIITSISIDHSEILGNNIETIALEKAGIIKKNIPVIIGPNTPLALFKDVAASLNSPLHTVSGSFHSYEEENQAIAKKALSLLPVSQESIEKGLLKKPPCRFEVIKSKEFNVEVILDVAHNPDGFEKLFQKIKQEYPQKYICTIVGMSRGKDIYTCFEILFESSDEIHFIQGNNERSLSIKELKIYANRFAETKTPCFYHSSIRDAIKSASSNNVDKVLVACGSFFIMEEIRMILGIEEESDEKNLNEKF